MNEQQWRNSGAEGVEAMDRWDEEHPYHEACNKCYARFMRMRMRAENAEARLLRASRALETIKRDEGKVCDQYETCEHRACQSSYGAWAIADSALRRIG